MRVSSWEKIHQILLVGSTTKDVNESIELGKIHNIHFTGREKNIIFNAIE